MTTTYNWEVTSLYTVDTPEDGLVVNANYKVTGTDGTYSSEISDSASFTFEEGQTLIPLADLTNEIVIGWIKEKLGVSAVENYEFCIADQIAMQVNPPVTPQNTPLPWIESE